MIKLKCDRCSQDFPTNNMVKGVESEKFFCQPCANKALQDTSNPLEGEVVRLVDPTVCAYCGSDSGKFELPMIANLPVCPQCDQFFRNRPFPNWIKISFAILILLVVFSIGWNLRFFQAYFDMRTSWHLYSLGNFAEASMEMSSAAYHVPESKDLQLFDYYIQGISLLNQSEFAEALEKLTKCESKLPPEFDVDGWILIAKENL